MAASPPSPVSRSNAVRLSVHLRPSVGPYNCPCTSESIFPSVRPFRLTIAFSSLSVECERRETNGLPPSTFCSSRRPSSRSQLKVLPYAPSSRPLLDSVLPVPAPLDFKQPPVCQFFQFSNPSPRPAVRLLCRPPVSVYCRSAIGKPTHPHCPHCPNFPHFCGKAILRN